MFASEDHTKSYRAKVPGKVMLAGEYSVLKGLQALASTVTSHLTVEIKPNESDYCQVASNIWQRPKLCYPKSRITSKNMLVRCVLDAKKYFACDQNFDLEVSSNFSIAHGIGSSSALRVGVFLAMEAFSGKPRSKKELFDFCLGQQRLFQSRASGYDIATQAYGGTISYRLHEDTGEISSLKNQAYDHFLCLVNEGGAPTEAMMSNMKDFLAKNAAWDEKFDQLNQELLTNLKNFIEYKTGSGEVIASMGAFRRLTEDSPMFIKILAHIQGSGLDEEWSFKTTGAGGEDAVLVFSKHPLNPDIKLNILNSFAPSGFVEAPFRLAHAKPHVETLGRLK